MLNKNYVSWMACIALGLPALIYICIFFRYATDMPYYDDYDAILGWTLEFVSTHNYRDRFLSLFQQHNEHRIVIVYLVNLLSVTIFHRINFIFISLFGSVGLFGIVAIMLYVGKRIGLSIYELIPVPFLLLGFSQNDLITCAMTAVQQYWQLLLVILAILFLTVSSKKICFTLACFTAILAVFSGGGGMLVFPVGFLYLVLSRKWGYAFSWLAITGLSLYFFFDYFDYQPASDGPKAHAFFLCHPFRSAEFMAGFCGNFGASESTAIAFGVLLLTGMAAIAIAKFRKLDETLLCIGSFLFLTAVVVTQNRAVYGFWGSLASRYTIYGLLNCTIVYMLVISSIRAKPWRYVLNILGVVIAVLIYVSWLAPGVSALKFNHNAEKTTLLTWSGKSARPLLQTAMREHMFYPVLLYRNLPSSIKNNPQYDRAWNQLFEFYLGRLDLGVVYPLSNTNSYMPLVKWAAFASPDNNPGFAELVPFQAVYRSMLGVLEH